MTLPSQNLWDYSVALYAQDGVASACRFLQDRLGMDVNLLLFCCWYGQRFGRLDEDILRPLLEFSRTWKARVVAPQREARRWMKDRSQQTEGDRNRFETLRRRIKLTELAAERYQQETMQAMVELGRSGAEPAPAAAPEDIAAANVKLMLTACGLEPDAVCRARLDLITGRACPPIA